MRKYLRNVFITTSSRPRWIPGNRMAEDCHHGPCRLTRSKRLRLASPPATTMSSPPQCLFSPCSLGDGGGDQGGGVGETEGEIFSDLTRRAISISSSEGLPTPGGEGSVVDLTNDSGVEDAELVDLTSPIDRSRPRLVLRGRREGHREGTERRGRMRGRDVVVLDGSDDESADNNEVQIMEPKKPLPSNDSQATPAEPTAAANVPSPTKTLIKCPICMENAATFERRGSHVAVTTCGHVFCSCCIHRALTEQRRCPACRKKLTVRQTHPLYLSV